MRGLAALAAILGAAAFVPPGDGPVEEVLANGGSAFDVGCAFEPRAPRYGPGPFMKPRSQAKRRQRARRSGLCS